MFNNFKKAITIQFNFKLKNTKLIADKEFHLLVKSIDIKNIISIIYNNLIINTSTFIGKGQIEKILNICKNNNIDIIIFNNTLTPIQQRNLEKILKKKIIDRTDLILNIFSKRARSHYGKLQVELAKLKYLTTRLIRAWTHLDRQKGATGIMSGPGETQLEIDRRLINKRIKYLQKKIKKIKHQNEMQRKTRNRNNIITISLIGYTNSGKSTIFNLLTKNNVYVKDKMFSTLDTISRRMYINKTIGSIILSDTVGFVKNLPIQLISAFRETIEETKHSKLLIHIIDLSNNTWRNQIDCINNIISIIGANKIFKLLIFNKIDKIDNKKFLFLKKYIFKKIEYNSSPYIFLSALKKYGIKKLLITISNIIMNNIYLK